MYQLLQAFFLVAIFQPKFTTLCQTYDTYYYIVQKCWRHIYFGQAQSVQIHLVEFMIHPFKFPNVERSGLGSSEANLRYQTLVEKRSTSCTNCTIFSRRGRKLCFKDLQTLIVLMSLHFRAMRRKESEEKLKRKKKDRLESTRMYRMAG